jgi:hypothetical protein
MVLPGNDGELEIAAQKSAAELGDECQPRKTLPIP